MEIQCQILQHYGFPYMPKDSVTPSKHYKGVAIGFFLHIVFSIFYIFTYNFRKHSSAYAKDNTLLLFLLIPAHLEVPLSMLITKEVPRARFPGGWWQAVRMKGKLPVSSTYLLAISQGNSHSICCLREISMERLPRFDMEYSQLGKDLCLVDGNNITLVFKVCQAIQTG